MKFLLTSLEEIERILFKIYFCLLVAMIFHEKFNFADLSFLLQEFLALTEIALFAAELYVCRILFSHFTVIYESRMLGFCNLP